MEIRMRVGVDEEVLAAAHAFYHTWSAGDKAALRGSDVQGELRLMPVSRGETDAWFGGSDRVTVTAWESGQLIGLVSGVHDAGRGCGYLSYLCVDPSRRRQKLGTALMDAWEAEMRAREGVVRFDAVFHNPVHLPWYVPGKGEDYHPCVPGIDVCSGLYMLLKNRGWRDFAIQNVYHQRLSGYRDPAALAASRARLLSEGIELTLYDPSRHRGLAELFDNINNPGWKAQVLSHVDRPIVVAVDHNADDLVVSYTGPLSVDGHPGRGNFCGIGTRTDYRGRGIGKLVFCEMCRRHGEAGASFMSLYTGENNPARNIYEAAGFRIVRTFADMRKVL